VAAHIWAALAAGYPIAVAMNWLNAFFNPSGGWLPSGQNSADTAGGHEFYGAVYIPPRNGQPWALGCANHWTAGWSADAPQAGYGLRPGDFIVPGPYLEDPNMAWEFRIVVPKAAQPQPQPQPDPNPQPEPQPNPQPQPGPADWKTPALQVIGSTVSQMQADLQKHPTSRTRLYEIRGAQEVQSAVQGA
jgi:hypothetical protein